MEYKYKQLTGLSIRDFRNLGTVDIDFTKSAIVCLKGGNEAGKSSVVIAIKTLGSNLSSKQYKEYIRTGTDGWAVMFYTADGRAVYRKKTATKQTYGIYGTVDGQAKLLWSIDKLDENAVPQEVQDIVGFTTEPETKELLNVRTYEDQMLFVETSGGSNYKVMYNALKIDNLTKAVKVGTAEAKQYKQEVDSYENSVLTCKEQLRKIRTIDVEPLQKIKKRINDEKKGIELLERAMELKLNLDKINKALGALSEINTLPRLDEYLFTSLESAILSKKQITEIETRHQTLEALRKLPIIDMSILDKFDSAISIKSTLANLNTNIYADLDKCGVVDVSLVEKLESAYSVYNTYKQVDNELAKYSVNLTVISEEYLSKVDNAMNILHQIKQIDTEYKSIREKVDYFYNTLKAMGIHYEVCPNCGELILPGESHAE
jgi:hypothetical protein